MNNFWDLYDLKNTIKISNNKEIRIAFAKKDNNIGIDIRNYFKKSNEWLPGKGTIIPVNKWEEFQEIINNIKK